METSSDVQEPNVFDELIFKSELNEVHLLLDFISGRPDIQISSIDLKMPKPGHPDETLNTFETITYVCKLRYPPDPDLSNRAADAALLTMVKDKLSSLAYPARGATIAYTYTFIEPAGYLTLPQDSRIGSERRSRTSVAREAYPSLYRNARAFRLVHRFMTAGSIVLTICAAVALWLVTYGVQITARFEDDRKQNTEMVEKIYQQVKLQDAKLSPGALGHPTPMERCTDLYLARQSGEISMLCNNWAYAQARYVKTISDACAFATQFPSKILMLLFPSEIGTESRRCRDRSPRDTSIMTAGTQPGNEATSFGSAQRELPLASASALRPRTAGKVASMLGATEVGPQPTKALSEPFYPSGSPAATAASELNAGAKAENRDDGSPEFATQEDIQSITLILSIYSNYVLPIIFGFLGTAASMLRSVGDKIKDCVLAPRDAALSFLRLPLGLMAGVTVGLFFNPTSVAQGISAGTGTLTITASGIAFLAGYGADPFFKLVDRMINQIFNVENHRDSKTAS